MLTSFTFNYFSNKMQYKNDKILLNQYFTINEIFNGFETGRLQLKQYLTDDTVESLRNLERTNKQLTLLSDKLFHSPTREDKAQRHLIDFSYQIETFVEQINAAITYHKDGNMLLANYYYQQVMKVNNLIRQNFHVLFQVVISDMEVVSSMSEKAHKRNLYLSLTILIIAIAFCVFTFYEIMFSIIHPINKLTSSAKKIAKKQFDLPPISKNQRASREIVILINTFNSMTAVINEQLEELERSRIIEEKLHQEELKIEKMNALVKESELSALQAKINPHFLFNTLNMVKQSAFLEKAKNTSDLVESFSSMLRYNLGFAEKVVTIKQETQILEDYVKIQQLRFAERIQFKLSVAEEALKATIPSFILQPLVENAVLHGLKMKLQDGKVDININRKDDKIIISVKDNGSGIDYENLEVINAYCRGDFSAKLASQSGVGLRNVISRLNLYYEGEENLRISSIAEQGTEVLIIVPYIEETA